MGGKNKERNRRKGNPMNTEVVQIRGNHFLRIEVVPVHQKGKTFYLAKIPARIVLDIYTSVPARYDIKRESALAATFQDDEDYFEYRLDLDRKRAESQDFERKLDLRRVNEIKTFLNDKEYALFPNTIIVTCELINDLMPIPVGLAIEDIEDLEDERLAGLSFLEEAQETEGTTLLYVPYKKDSILVIDGQHRLRGLEEADKADKNLIDGYDLLVTFIIGFNRSVIAELFYTINYTQKPVNRSLLYHLMGEFSRELDEITFMHEAVRILNEVTQSPFYKRIKMLGTVDEKASDEEKAKMTISQAFLIDYLKTTISESARKSVYPPIFLYYYKDEKQRIEIIRFLMRYFGAIKQLRQEDWEHPAQSIICNTLGVGAFIRVLHFLFVKMFVEEFNNDPSKLRDVKVDNLVTKLRGIENVDFSKEGEFGRGASAGGLNKLKEELVEKIAYFDTRSYNDFYGEYRSNYLARYRDWLGNNKKHNV